jgi:hypothetical protein
MVTDVKRRGEKMMRSINVYNQRDVQTGARRARKLSWHRAIQQGGGTIIAGDMNAQSRWWDPRWREQRHVTMCEEIIDEYGLEIGNDHRLTHHWARRGKDGELITDLTLATRPITQWTILEESHATDSDYEVIEWEFNPDKQEEEADHVQIIGWHLAAMSNEDEEAAEKLCQELERDRAHLGEECMGDDVEREAEWCQATQSKVGDAKEKKYESGLDWRGGGTARSTIGEAHWGEKREG